MGPRDDLFDVDGLRDMQRRARRLSAGLSQGLDPRARTDGWDKSRTVRVTMDGSGRIVDAQIGPSWRDAVGSAGLGAAVVEAADAATAERMESWTQAMEQPVDDVPDDFEDPSADLNPSRSLRDPAVLESTRELFHLTMDAIDRLSEVTRSMDELTVDQVSGRSPDGRVTVTVESGRLASVDFDQSMLREMTAVEITQRLRAALSAADQAGPQAAAAKALDNFTIREFQQATADPRELLRRLGLG
jgi:DNA-binding protein YbaB